MLTAKHKAQSREIWITWNLSAVPFKRHGEDDIFFKPLFSSPIKKKKYKSQVIGKACSALSYSHQLLPQLLPGQILDHAIVSANNFGTFSSLSYYCDFSALSQFSMHILDVSSNNSPDISSQWYNSQFNFFLFLAKPTILILSPIFYFHLLTTKGHNHPWLLTVSWSTHLGCSHVALFIIVYRLYLVLSAEPFTWA